jgi:hypothetical protein
VWRRSAGVSRERAKEAGNRALLLARLQAAGEAPASFDPLCCRRGYSGSLGPGKWGPQVHCWASGGVSVRIHAASATAARDALVSTIADVFDDGPLPGS